MPLQLRKDFPGYETEVKLVAVTDWSEWEHPQKKQMDQHLLSHPVCLLCLLVQGKWINAVIHVALFLPRAISSGFCFSSFDSK